MMPVDVPANVEAVYEFLEEYRDGYSVPYIYAGTATPANFLEGATYLDLTSDVLHDGHRVKWKETRVAGVDELDEALVTRSCELDHRVTTGALTGLCIIDVSTVEYLKGTVEWISAEVVSDDEVVIKSKTIGSMDCPAITTTPEPPPQMLVPCSMETTARYTKTAGQWMRYRTEKIAYPMYLPPERGGGARIVYSFSKALRIM